MEFPQTIVVSLSQDLARREHVVRHFHQLGIERFGFWPAVSHDDPAVADLYLSGKVLAWPPCFRCGQPNCACENNILLPQQVANWLSFIGLWRSLPDDPDHYVLVCEDDVAFHPQSLDNLRDFLDGFERQRRHVLIRLAQSGLQPFVTQPRARPQRSGRVVMSNAAYIVNGAMAQRLVRAVDTITHTSDVWLHRTMAAGDDVEAFTLEPLLATDLSYNKDHARFASRIHPKGIDPADCARMAAHRKRVDNDAEYAEVRASWGAWARG
jgi:GR25 family glycosyltransferase involved in LPS biosynthesis